MKPITVVGSINMDVVNYVVSFPQPGETILGKETAHHPGGKGANQAVAASLSAASVSMIGAIGDDSYGGALQASLAAKGVLTDLLLTKEGNSGVAYITVNEKAENQIILSPGSNGKITPSDIIQEKIQNSSLLLLQNEIPWETNLRVVELAELFDIPVFLNPAPAMKLTDESLLTRIHTIILNETEAEVITGKEVQSIDQAKAASRSLLDAGASNVLLTMGSKGALLCSQDGSVIFVPAFSVNAVDTTAAGDTFIGAYAAAYLTNRSAEEKLRYAAAAAALTVTRKGAQESIPSYEEIVQFLEGSPPTQ